MPRSTDAAVPGDAAARRRVRDGLLATVPFVAALAAVGLGLVRPEPTAMLVGAAIAVVAEALATRHERTVRNVWERHAVQLVATAGAVLAVAAGAVWSGGSAGPVGSDGSAGTTLVSLVAGGLGAYLLVLAVVAVRSDP